MSKSKRRKRLFVFASVICVALTLVLTGYSANALMGENGFLTAPRISLFTDSALRVELFPIWFGITAGHADAEIELTMLPGADGRPNQTAEVTLHFTEPGDTATIDFVLFNSGSMNARMERFIIINGIPYFTPYVSNYLPGWITLSGNFATIPDTTLRHTSASQIYSVTFTLTDNAAWQAYLAYHAANGTTFNSEGYPFTIAFSYVLA